MRIHDPDEFLRVEGAAQVQFLNSPRAPDLGRRVPAASQASPGPTSSADPAALSQPSRELAEAIVTTTTQQSLGIWIPLVACRPDSSGKTAAVLIVANGRLKEATVNLGRREGANVEVVSGLTVGQEIAAEIQKAKPGQSIHR